MARVAPHAERPSDSGEMAERSKAHAWKACVGQPTVGSNPTLSARFARWSSEMIRTLTLRDPVLFASVRIVTRWSGESE